MQKKTKNAKKQNFFKFELYMQKKIQNIIHFKKSCKKKAKIKYIQKR